MAKKLLINYNLEYLLFAVFPITVHTAGSQRGGGGGKRAGGGVELWDSFFGFGAQSPIISLPKPGAQSNKKLCIKQTILQFFPCAPADADLAGFSKRSD